MKKCPRLVNRSPEQIASFLIRKFQNEKVKYIIDEFAGWGFTKETLLKSKNALFQFLVLVSFDRRPYSPYELVWDINNPTSVFSTLKRSGLLELNKVKSLSEEELNKILKTLTVKNLHLSYLDLAKRIKTAKTMKEISSKIEQVAFQLNNMNSAYDVMRLHQMLDDIHGIGPTIASKFIMYTVRCMGIGNIDPSNLDLIAKHLQNEWRNSKWVKQLEEIGKLEDVYQRLKEDPFSFDYFWDLDRYYCSQEKCDECEF
jgi:ribosomal protein S13